MTANHHVRANDRTNFENHRNLVPQHRELRRGWSELGITVPDPEIKTWEDFFRKMPTQSMFMEILSGGGITFNTDFPNFEEDRALGSSFELFIKDTTNRQIILRFLNSSNGMQIGSQHSAEPFSGWNNIWTDRNNTLDAGWARLPNGLILQWGRVHPLPLGDVSIQMRLAFPMNDFVLVGNTIQGGNVVHNLAVSNGHFRVFNSHTNANTVIYSWFAIGR
jgi:hypothetical protein